MQLVLTYMISGSKPRCLSDDVMPFHPVMFQETWVDMRHDVKNEGTRLSGLPTIKATFPGCHVIFIILKKSTQVNSHGLRPGLNIHDPGSFRHWSHGNLPPCLQRTTVQCFQLSWDVWDRVRPHPVKLLHPVCNSKHLTG